MEALRAQFAAVDANQDGRIDKDELKAMVTDLGGQTDYLVDLIMALADTDGDGQTDFEEFVAAASALPDKRAC